MVALFLPVHAPKTDHSSTSNRKGEAQVEFKTVDPAKTAATLVSMIIRTYSKSPTEQS